MYQWSVMIFFGVVVLILFLISRRLASIEQRLAALERPARPDMPRSGLGTAGARVPAGLPTGASDGVLEALRSGNKIEAIRRYRLATGVGLQEAKDYVEGLERGR